MFDHLDLINSLFELGGTILTVSNIRAILISKKVEGVYWQVTAFFSIWGCWNVYYYYHLDQIYSTWVAGLLAVANAVWVYLALYYMSINKLKEERKLHEY